MSFKQFTTDALRTESRPDSLKVNPGQLTGVLQLAALTAQLLDKFKKAAFYGKALNAAETEAYLWHIVNTANQLANGMETQNDPEGETSFRLNSGDDVGVEITPTTYNMRLAHAFIGSFTEAGELLEALLRSAQAGVPVDAVNVQEEYADADYYKAIAFDELGLDEDKSRAAVIAKLKVRYPDKFDAAKAETRDLVAERAALEQANQTA